jgi:hypothetical protein
LPYFLDKKTNVKNIDITALTWKPNYAGSNILSWKEKGAVNLYIAGHFASGNLTTAVSDFGFDPAYRLNLAVEPETATALQAIPFRRDVHALLST